MTRPLAINGWFRIEPPSGPAKVLYIDDWDNEEVRILLKGKRNFIPVHVLSDEELASYVKDKLLSG